MCVYVWCLRHLILLSTEMGQVDGEESASKWPKTATVVGIRPETPDIRTFRLLVEGEGTLTHLPGQYAIFSFGPDINPGWGLTEKVR